MERSTVWLGIGLGELSRLEPPRPPHRYERARLGELIHIDVKKLVRIENGTGHRVTGKRTTHVKGVGWERVHVCVDDARLGYVEVLGDERQGPRSVHEARPRLLRDPRHDIRG